MLQLAQQGEAALAGPLGCWPRAPRPRRAAPRAVRRLSSGLVDLVLQDEQIAAVEQDAERGPETLHGPLRRVGGRLDVAAPDELGPALAGRARRRGGTRRESPGGCGACAPASGSRSTRLGKVASTSGDVRVLSGGDHQGAGRVALGQLRHPPGDAAADGREIVGEQELGSGHSANLLDDRGERGLVAVDHSGQGKLALDSPSRRLSESPTSLGILEQLADGGRQRIGVARRHQHALPRRFPPAPRSRPHPRR